MEPCETFTTIQAFCADDSCEHCVYYSAVIDLVRRDLPDAYCDYFSRNLVTCAKEVCAYCDRVRVIVHELANSPEAPAVELMENIPSETHVFGSRDGLNKAISNFHRTTNGGISLTVTSDDFQALVYSLRCYAMGGNDWSDDCNDPARRTTAHEWLKELAERFGVEFE